MPGVRHASDGDEADRLRAVLRCGAAPDRRPAAAPVTNADALTSRELKAELDRGDQLVILDVREPQEFQINRLPGSILIPLGDLPKRYVELDPNANIVTQCKSGMRSAKAQDFLRSKGFTRVRNLTGGVLGWIDQVDPTQPKY